MTPGLYSYKHYFKAVILAFLFSPKHRKGDWNIKKGGNLMSKRTLVRSKRRTTRPAKYRQLLKRKEARKCAKHRKRIYYRKDLVPHSRCKGA